MRAREENIGKRKKAIVWRTSRAGVGHGDLRRRAVVASSMAATCTEHQGKKATRQEAAGGGDGREAGCRREKGMGEADLDGG